MTTNEVMPSIQNNIVNNQPKNIASLFNELQVSVDQTKTRLLDKDEATWSHLSSSSTSSSPSSTSPKQSMDRNSISSTNSSTSMSPITPHPTISTNSTKTTTTTARSSLITCACHHWLVSMDSEHCAICDEPIEYLSQWQTERIVRSKELRNYKRQLMDCTTLQDQQQNDMMALQRKIVDHREMLMIRDEEMISLQQDMEKLQTKYNEESAQIEAIEVEKQAARKEIEDLGQHLFKEARDMVETEKNEILELQQSYENLKQELQKAQSELDTSSEELKLLKKEMTNYNDMQLQENNNHNHNNNMAILLRHQQQQYYNNINNITDDHENNNNNNNNNQTNNPDDINNKNIKNLMLNTSSNVNNLSDDLIKIPTTPSQAFHLRAHIDLLSLQENHPLKETIQLETFEDDQQLTEFQEFLDSATSTTFSLKKLHGLPFMALCLQDDIEPCLRFGSQPKVASKKILEAIQIKTCFVEKCPPGYVREYADYLRRERYAKKSKPSLWDKFASARSSSNSSSSSSSSSSSPTASTSTSTSSTSSTSISSISTDIMNGDGYILCAACGRKVKDNEEDATVMEKELCYRFRISYFDEWSCIDRYCANRLNSVIAFYTFLRQLRLGNFKERSLMDVYQECSRLRLQMCLSRMGSLPNNLTVIQ